MKKLLMLLILTVLASAAVDINNASLKELTTLKGIGKKKAKSIINYRKKHCFKSIDELTKVKGIGKKTVEKNSSEIVIGECK